MPRALYFPKMPASMRQNDSPPRWGTVPFIFLLFRIQMAFCQENVANSVVGDPYVNCAADAVYVKLKTQTTFMGHVSVKFTPNKYCYQVLVTNNQIEVLIPHEECAVTRRRSFHPAGLIIEAAVTVSFHPEFTTVDDRIFNFNCFHLQKKKGHGLEVGSATMPPPEITPGPQCSYRILSGLGGRPVGTVTMGQKVYHEWQCSQTKDTCLIVRNCYLVGADKKYPLIDANGCSRDTNILRNLDYKNETYASQTVSVFGVSSTTLVYFQCELLLAPSSRSSHCETPNCSKEHNITKRSINEHMDSVMEVQSQRIEISELASLQDLKSNVELSELNAKCDELVRTENDDFCVSLSVFAISVGLLVSVAVFVLFLASLAMLQRYKYYSVTNTATN